jgi:predicted small lipoprotein YifL
MKIISQLLLVIFAVATLAACGEQGQGPSRPKDSSPIEMPQK